jgi:predicted TIM-barrel fold metal-dependent hydrolase
VRTITHGRVFLDALPISPADKAKISHLNAEKRLKLPAPK